MNRFTLYFCALYLQVKATRDLTKERIWNAADPTG